MIRYELKKVFSRPSNKIALLLLAAVLLGTAFLACNVRYVDADGQLHTGPAAARQLRAQQKAWAGPLSEETLARMLQENQAIVHSPEYTSEDPAQQDKAFHRLQAFEMIRSLTSQAYATDFQSYDYYTTDSLTPADAPNFYPNRVQLLSDWLQGEGGSYFTAAEQAFLLDRYASMESPWEVDYVTGWAQFYNYIPTVLMIAVIFAGYLVSGIFSGEKQWRADALFFSAYHGRGKAVSAKVKAGLLLLTLVYWLAILFFSAVVLFALGADGAGCPIQVIDYKSFYDLTILQGALLIALGGYVGALTLGLLAMLLSAKTNSTVLAAIFPFAAMFLPALFLTGDINTLMSNILAVLPDRLVQFNRVFGYFDLYQVGEHVVSAIPILLTLYTALSLLLLPTLYLSYRRKRLA